LFFPNFSHVCDTNFIYHLPPRLSERPVIPWYSNCPQIEILSLNSNFFKLFYWNIVKITKFSEPNTCQILAKLFKISWNFLKFAQTLFFFVSKSENCVTDKISNKRLSNHKNLSWPKNHLWDNKLLKMKIKKFSGTYRYLIPFSRLLRSYFMNLWIDIHHFTGILSIHGISSFWCDPISNVKI
jgi:hypothetical protein